MLINSTVEFEESDDLMSSVTIASPMPKQEDTEQSYQVDRIPWLHSATRESRGSIRMTTLVHGVHFNEPDDFFSGVIRICLSFLYRQPQNNRPRGVIRNKLGSPVSLNVVTRSPQISVTFENFTPSLKTINHSSNRKGKGKKKEVEAKNGSLNIQRQRKAVHPTPTYPPTPSHHQHHPNAKSEQSGSMQRNNFF